MRRIFLIIAVIAVVATPLVAQAVSWIPIVPCGRASQGATGICTPCSLFQGLKNVTDLVLFGITGPIAAFMVVLAGGMMLLGGANPSQFSRGKTLLTNTLIGVTIILLSWVATNFLIKSVATGSSGDEWFEFTCPAFLQAVQVRELTLPAGYGVGSPPTPAPGPFIGLPPGVNDAAMARIASFNGAKYPRQNSPALESLLSCIYSDPVVAAMTGPRPANGGRQSGNNFTYGNTYEACNYTHGYPILGGGCDHGRYSCHYGGAKGSNGAEATDLNALLRRVEVPGLFDSTGRPVTKYASEEQLFCELYRVLVTERKCSDFKFIDLHNEHSHISTTACDKDGLGTGRTFNPAACKSLLAIPPGSSTGP